MARSHAKLLVAIWRNPDWVALTLPAQWCFTTILSQPRLTLVGSLDLTPGRWATLATDVTAGQLEAAVDELEAARFVVCDRDTAEVMIRTFTAHDLDPNRVNANLAKGLWRQWAAIASPRLRAAAVTEMPAPVWERLEPHAPTDAAQTRRSPQLQPGGPARLPTEEADPTRTSLTPFRPSHPDTYPPDREPPPGSAVLLDPPPAPKIPPENLELERQGIAAARRTLHPTSPDAA